MKFAILTYAGIILTSMLPRPVFAIPMEEKAPQKESEHFNCDSAREFIGAFEYLTDSKTFKMKKTEAITLARKVSIGCDGAAERFIKVSELLRRSGLDSASSLSIGKDFSLATDMQADAFAAIFKKSYLRDYLDLDIVSSIETARRLSVDFKGDHEQALEDFEDIVEYCLDREELALPRQKCAQIASDFSLYGEKSQSSIFEPFVEGLEFLARDDDGPNLTTLKAIEILNQIMATSPNAPRNLIEAYEYAYDKDGLGLSRAKAITIAIDISKKTYKKLL